MVEKPLFSSSIFFNVNGDFNVRPSKNENISLYIKITTKYGIDLKREIKLKICGFETVSIASKDFDFEYDDKTEIVILPSDY